MAEEFRPITTQEELDAVIKDRLKRQESSIRSEYADYEDLKKRSEAWQKSEEKYKADIDTLSGRVKGYETDSVKRRIAHELELPYGAETRLFGETEEEIRKDAEGLKALIGSQKAPVAPLKSPEPEGDNPNAMYAALAKSLKE